MANKAAKTAKTKAPVYDKVPSTFLRLAAAIKALPPQYKLRHYQKIKHTPTQGITQR